MTTDSWKQEFYAVPANDLRRHSDIKCTQHALTKWEGALPQNCQKHNVVFSGFVIKAIGAGIHPYEELMIFGAKTCALCAKYPKTINNADSTQCTNKSGTKICPLNLILNHSCMDHDSIYKQSYGNPTIMVATLQRTLDVLQYHNAKNQANQSKP